MELAQSMSKIPSQAGGTHNTDEAADFPLLRLWPPGAHSFIRQRVTIRAFANDKGTFP